MEVPGLDEKRTHEQYQTDVIQALHTSATTHKKECLTGFCANYTEAPWTVHWNFQSWRISISRELSQCDLNEPPKKLYYIQVNKTSQLPSFEVYFWYDHQNFYKTFCDNNILKEEPCFCAWTRLPQKCFRSEYSKKNKNANKKKKKNQQQTNYQRKQCSAYLHLQKSLLSAGHGWEGDLIYMESFQDAAIWLELARKQRLILILLSISYLSVAASSCQLQEWNAGHLNKSFLSVLTLNVIGV